MSEPGDVLVFHCLTPHAALPNQGSTLRISGDFRWQRSDEPAPAELVLGPAGRPPECSADCSAANGGGSPCPPA